jgi:hypothetical protein
MSRSGEAGISTNAVMPGLDPGIHDFLPCSGKDVDGRDKPGHDAANVMRKQK